MTHSVGIPQSEVGHLNPVVGTSAIGIVAHRYSHRSAVSSRDHRDPSHGPRPTAAGNALSEAVTAP